MIMFDDLNEHQQAKLREWRRNWRTGSGPIGLWICGPRRCGSSSIADVACRNIPEGMPTGKVTARLMMKEIRELWSLEGQVRDKSDDGLWAEYDNVRSGVEDWYDGTYSVLWVDDLHDDVVDISFWRKHIQPDVEARLKAALPVVVATTLPPNDDKLEGLQIVIEDLFVVVDARR